MRFQRVGKVLIERSTFCGFIRYNFLFVFAPQGLLFPTRGKVDRKGSPGGGTLSPYRGYPLPAPTEGEGRGGKDKIQRDNNVLQKRVWVLKMGTVAITGVYARGLFYKNRLDTTRAGRKRKILCA